MIMRPPSVDEEEPPAPKPPRVQAGVRDVPLVPVSPDDFIRAMAIAAVRGDFEPLARVESGWRPFDNQAHSYRR